MAILTNTADVAVNLQGYYDRNLIENTSKALLYDMLAQLRPIPKNSGTRINFRRYGKIPVNLTPLSDGVTPTGKKLSSTDIYATVKQYGDFVTLTDWLMMVGLDANLLDISDNLLSVQMAETKDTIIRDTVVAGTSVRYGNGVSARTSVVTALSDEDISSVVRTLEANDAKKIKKITPAGSGINSSPIGAAYIAITHPDARFDIEGRKGFIPVHEYASRDSLSDMKGEVVEIGSTGGVRWLATSNAKIWADGGGAVGVTGLVSTSASNIDVYGTVIFGKDAYGTVPLSKESVKMIIRQLGQGEDPLNQRATVGWKMATTSRILNDELFVRIEHGVTSL